MVDRMLRMRSGAPAAVRKPDELMRTLDVSERTVYVVGTFAIPMERSRGQYISWLGLMDRKKEEILRLLRDDLRFELDLRGYARSAKMDDFCVRASGAELKSWYKRLDAATSSLDTFRSWSTVAGQHYFGTVDFPAALSGALQQRLEEVAEDKATEQFERNVREAEERGEVYDDGCGGIDVTVSDAEADDDSSSHDSDNDFVSAHTSNAVVDAGAEAETSDKVKQEPGAEPEPHKPSDGNAHKTLKNALFADDDDSID